jgi:hypothetical protein
VTFCMWLGRKVAQFSAVSGKGFGWLHASIVARRGKSQNRCGDVKY